MTQLFAYLREDSSLVFSSLPISGGLEVPDELAQLYPDQKQRILYKDGAFFDRDSAETLWVSPDGVKSVTPRDGWQEVQARYTDVLVKGDDGLWQIEPSGAVLKKELLALAANLRWQKETGGITFDGAPVQTDRASQSALTMLTATTQSTDFSDPISWKTKAGFRLFDGDDIALLAFKVTEHIQACFRLEADAVQKITAGEITSPQQLAALFE
jgi:hypothetical protein